MARRNPLFPYFYKACTKVADRAFYNKIRAETLADARDRLLIVGLGPGNDLLHLPPAVTSVAAVEPDAAMRKMAGKLAARRGIEVEIAEAGGEALPFEDASFDTVLSGLVLCTVDDVPAALAEVRRVLTAEAGCWCSSMYVTRTVRGWRGCRTGWPRPGRSPTPAASPTGVRKRRWWQRAST